MKLKELLLGATLLCAGTTVAVAQDSFTFTSYGGAFQEAQRKALLDPVEEEMGITINEDTLTGLTEVRAQVRSGSVNWDIVDLGLNGCAAGAEEGLFEELDYDVIPTEGFEEAAYSDHWIGIIYFSTVLGFSTETYPDDQPQSWQDFWDTEKFPGARAMRNDPAANLEIALMADGVDPDDLYPLDMDRAFDKLDEIKDDVAVWWESGAQSAQLIADGEVDMTTIWNGRLDAAVEDGAEADYTYHNAVASLDCLAIPKGAPNKDLAMKALARMVSPELQANMPQYINYGPTTSLAFDHDAITDEMRERSPSSPENLETQATLSAEWWEENEREAQERWDAWMTQ